MKQLGQILTPADKVAHGTRDAFHAPCILVKSAEIMHAGDQVKFMDKSFNTVAHYVHDKEQMQAVVDPFLPRPARVGEMFWVLLVPNVTSNLKHFFDVTLEIKHYNPPYTPPITAKRRYSVDDSEDECRGCY